MTDRDQTRRDVKARDRLAVWLDDFNAGYATLAGLRFDVRALLAELEQAERERDEALLNEHENAVSAEVQRQKAIQAERERDEALSERDMAYADTDEDIVARLAKVPALVEALSRIEQDARADGNTWIAGMARKARDDWEQDLSGAEPGERPDPAAPVQTITPPPFRG